MIPRIVYAMADGNYSYIGMFHKRLRTGRFSPMPMAMDTASGSTAERLQQIDKQAAETLLSDAINFPMNVVMPKLRELDLGDEFRSDLVSDIPVLAISGTADGRTPVSNATEILKTLSNGQHLVVDGAGHGEPLFVSSPKILETMKRFFQGDTIESTTIKLPPIKIIK